MEGGSRRAGVGKGGGRREDEGWEDREGRVRRRGRERGKVRGGVGRRRRREGEKGGVEKEGGGEEVK